MFERFWEHIRSRLPSRQGENEQPPQEDKPEWTVEQEADTKPEWEVVDEVEAEWPPDPIDRPEIPPLSAEAYQDTIISGPPALPQHSADPPPAPDRPGTEPYGGGAGLPGRPAGAQPSVPVPPVPTPRKPAESPLAAPEPQTKPPLSETPFPMGTRQKATQEPAEPPEWTVSHDFGEGDIALVPGLPVQRDPNWGLMPGTPEPTEGWESAVPGPVLPPGASLDAPPPASPTPVPSGDPGAAPAPLMGGAEAAPAPPIPGTDWPMAPQQAIQSPSPSVRDRQYPVGPLDTGFDVAPMPEVPGAAPIPEWAVTESPGGTPPPAAGLEPAGQTDTRQDRLQELIGRILEVVKENQDLIQEMRNDQRDRAGQLENLERAVDQVLRLLPALGTVT